MTRFLTIPFAVAAAGFFSSLSCASLAAAATSLDEVLEVIDTASAQVPPTPAEMGISTPKPVAVGYEPETYLIRWSDLTVTTNRLEGSAVVVITNTVTVTERLPLIKATLERSGDLTGAEWLPVDGYYYPLKTPDENGFYRVRLEVVK